MTGPVPMNFSLDHLFFFHILFKKKCDGLYVWKWRVADMVTKSANYCVGNSAREACIFLCAVALGEMKELFCTYSTDRTVSMLTRL